MQVTGDSPILSLEEGDEKQPINIRKIKFTDKTDKSVINKWMTDLKFSAARNNIHLDSSTINGKAWRIAFQKYYSEKLERTFNERDVAFTEPQLFAHLMAAAVNKEVLQDEYNRINIPWIRNRIKTKANALITPLIALAVKK